MTGFLLFGAVIAVLIVTMIRAAMRSGEDTGMALTPGEREEAAAHAMSELEMDYATGKLSKEEYSALRSGIEGEVSVVQRSNAGLDSGSTGD